MTDISYHDTATDHAAVLATPDEIDITNAGQLRAALLGAAEAGYPVVVADMTATRFCDSTGLHVLITAHKRARARGGELRLVIPAAGPVPQIIALTGLRNLMPCFSSLEDALASSPDTTKPQAIRC